MKHEPERIEKKKASGNFTYSSDIFYICVCTTGFNILAFAFTCTTSSKVNMCKIFFKV